MRLGCVQCQQESWSPGLSTIRLFDFAKPHLRPRHDLAANVVHSAHASDVDHVIVDGRFLLRKGELTTLDEEKLMRETERRAFRLVGSEMQQVREYKG